MPGIKGVNCSSVKVESPVPARKDEAEQWKFYDNPFFVAAVASAVVEATLSSSSSSSQDVVRDCVEKEKKQGEKISSSNNRARPRNFSCGTSPSRVTPPRTPKVQLQQQSPEVRRKQQQQQQQKQQQQQQQQQRQQQQQQQPVEDSSQKLRLELLKAWTSVERLEKAHSAARSKLEQLSSRFEDGRSLWESQVQDKITSSLQAMRHKLKEEKDTNRSLELANQKLEAELLEIRNAIGQAKKDMVTERNSKRMIEDVCDELAKEVGNDRELVVELRQQSSTARREADETRKALQMGEVWKEEKVQGRLVEAKFEIERKSGALDAAIGQMEAFLSDREKLLEKVVEIQQASGNSSSGSSPRSVTKQGSEKRIYKEQTRLLLNGSGFHMRNKSYTKNGAKAAVIPKVWPTSKSSNFE